MLRILLFAGTKTRPISEFWFLRDGTGRTAYGENDKIPSDTGRDGTPPIYTVPCPTLSVSPQIILVCPRWNTLISVARHIFRFFNWPAGSFSWLLEFIKSFLVGFWHTCFRISKNGSGLHPSFSCFSNDLVSNFSVGQQVVLVGFWYFFRFFSCLLGFYPNFSVGQQVVSVGFWDVFS